MEQLNPTQPQSAPVDPMDQFSKEPTQPVEPVQVVPPQPPVVPLAKPENTFEQHRSKTPLIVMLSLLVVLVLLIGFGAFFALVAYGKVDISNKELERKISFAVQALPFTPKTPEYLIHQSFEAQRNIKSMYIDTSIALSGSIETGIPGLGNSFDLVIQGPIDLHDKENPKTQINIKMTPELDADLAVVNDKLFFKINNIPAVLKGFAAGAGFSLDPFMAKWIFYDLKSLESDARDTLNEDKGVRDEERLEKIKTAILNSDAINKIVVTETSLDGNPVYQMSLEMTSEEYMKFVNDVARAVDPAAYSNQLVTETEVSQSFENLKITAYLDKDTMNTVKSII